MNTSMIRLILGHVIRLEGFFLLLPCVIALIYKEDQLSTYLIIAGVCLIIGSLLSHKKAKDNVFYLKEGCVV